MELIPVDNNSPKTQENNYVIDDKDLEDKVFSFEISLEKECQEYGYDRGLRKTSQLYKENLRLENKLIEKEIEIKEYKNKIEHLRMLLESKTPKYIRNCGLDEISTPDILTPDVNNT